MEVYVNSEKLNVDAGISVSALLDSLAVDARAIAVERNLAIVPKSTYDDARLSEGDRIEIVHFVGGG